MCRKNVIHTSWDRFIRAQPCPTLESGRRVSVFVAHLSLKLNKRVSVTRSRFDNLRSEPNLLRPTMYSYVHPPCLVSFFPVSYRLIDDPILSRSCLFVLLGAPCLSCFANG